MPTRVLRAARFTDAQVIALFEAVMARWATNAPLLAVGGFSYSYPSEEWRRAVSSTNTSFVSSATLSAQDAAFSILFRRSRDRAAPDEIEVSWNDAEQEDQPVLPAAEATLLQQLADHLGRAEIQQLPSAPQGPSTAE